MLSITCKAALDHGGVPLLQISSLADAIYLRACVHVGWSAALRKDIHVKLEVTRAEMQSIGIAAGECCGTSDQHHSQNKLLHHPKPIVEGIHCGARLLDFHASLCGNVHEERHDGFAQYC